MRPIPAGSTDWGLKGQGAKWARAAGCGVPVGLITHAKWGRLYPRARSEVEGLLTAGSGLCAAVVKPDGLA